MVPSTPTIASGTPLNITGGPSLPIFDRASYFSFGGNIPNLVPGESPIAKRYLKVSKLIKKYAGYEGMIIDDLGYIRQTREEMEVVFTLLAERYELGSVLLTNNLPFSK